MSAFDKIYGYDSLKEKMIKTCDMLKNREKYKKLGATIPKGVLIHGGPGLGKTLIAECFIEECGLWANTIRRNDDDADFILHMKNIFELARKNTPSIVF